MRPLNLTAVRRSLAFLLPLGAAFAVAEPPLAQPSLRLRALPVPVSSYRLLSMTRDDDGSVWAGSIHRSIHRYDPRTGAVETVKLPYDAVAASCICAGKKVYVLGQTYPKLIVYDREKKTFAEFPYGTPNPDVWYGTDAIDGRHLLLFDRNAGVVRWDTQADTGELLPWPYDAPFPLGGRYEPRDEAVWCQSFDLAGGQYVPLGLSRLDPKTGTFTGWFPYPEDDADLEPDTDPDAAFFVPYTLKGKLIPFDFQQGRWCRFLDVPGDGERFGFIGLGTLHQGRWYFSISTYDGDEVGCDGKPYHFVNGLLEFDPRTRSFAIPTLEAKDAPRGPSDAYYQVAYTLSAGGEFFATGTNIREPDGSLNGVRAGEVVFWQTVGPSGTP
jgi:streptogramin lyase